jgi:glycosyltransferase involved in cell wall biosynthesis
MKILFLQPEFHINQEPLIRALERRGHTVRFLTRNIGHSGTERAFDKQNLNDARLPDLLFNTLHIPHDIRKVLAWPSVSKLNKFVTQFDPDIFIARNYHIYTGIAFALSQWHRCSFALYTQDPAGTVQTRRVKSTIDRIIDHIADNTVPVYTPSPAVGPHARHLRYVPFAVETAPDRPFEQKPWSEDRTCKIITVAPYIERKRVDLLIQSLSNIVSEFDINVNVYGPGADDSNPVYKRCQNLITVEGLDSQVSLHDGRPNHVIRKDMYESDLFVLPSVREPASYSQLEAMAEGLPVICTEANGTAGYIEDRQSGMIIEPDSATALTEAIRTYCESQATRIMAGRKSRELAMSHHDPFSVAERFESAVLEYPLKSDR